MKKCCINLILCFLSLASLSPTHWVDQQEPSKSDNGAAEQKPTKTQEPSPTTPPSQPSSSPPVNSGADKKDTTKKNNEGREEPTYWEKVKTPEILPNWILAIIGFFGTLAALITLVFLYYQSKDTQRALHWAKRNAIAAKESAEAAKSTAESTARQTENLITGERAWIMINTGEVPDNFDSTATTVGILHINPIIQNVGKTVGWLKHGFIRYYKIAQNAKLPPEPDYSGNMAKLEVSVMVPPSGYVQPLHVAIPYSEFTTIRQGIGKLYVYGFIDYIDIGGNERQTRFCLEYHVPGGFDAQPRGWYIAVDAPLTYIRST